jgi:hypothetical protein
MRQLVVCTIVAVVLTGCFQRPWTPTLDREHVSTHQNASVGLPKGWMVSGRKDLLLVTRDGVVLQNIILETVSVEEELKFTKKKFKSGMLPFEQSEVILDNLASNPARTAFKVHKKEPAKVAGHQAFRAEISFRDQDGLQYRGILYGFMQNNWFYLMRYMAPERHYFTRDRDLFEQSVKSLKLLI